MKVFLSYSSKDKALVDQVYSNLEGNTTWLDSVDVTTGDNIISKVNEGIRVSTHFVLFWSKEASLSPWVEAEYSAAFIKKITENTRFLIFCLDSTVLPPLLSSIHHQEIDISDIAYAARTIAEGICKDVSSIISREEILNRSQEIGNIEDAVLEGKKVILLQGMMGIGKYSIVQKAIRSLFRGNDIQPTELDFQQIPALPELSYALASVCNQEMPFDRQQTENIRKNVQFFLEQISTKNNILVFRNVKGWLNEDGSFNEEFKLVLDTITKKSLFKYPVFITSTRFVELSPIDAEQIVEIPVDGLEDRYIAQIIKQNLLCESTYDEEKTKQFSKRLYGYPLAAKFAAHCVSNNGYDYYLSQDDRFKKLKIAIAKDIIDYSSISDACKSYLEIVALCESRMYNYEYKQVFGNKFKDIIALADEAVSARILSLDETSRYKLEPITREYFESRAFQSEERKENCNRLKRYLSSYLANASISNQMRLGPLVVRMNLISGHVKDALSYDEQLTKTIINSIWDLYNNRDYEEAYRSANDLLDYEKYRNNYDLHYIIALCLIRNGKNDEARKKLDWLIQVNPAGSYKYYSAKGRIERQLGNYSIAIDYFYASIANDKNKKYLAPHRELIGCFISSNQLDAAKKELLIAKRLDADNVFVSFYEARILEEDGKINEAIALLENMISINEHKDQLFFRLGRAYDKNRNAHKACYYYSLSLKENKRMIDSELCLLNHNVEEQRNNEIEKRIRTLQYRLSGKRYAILTNIQARYVGFNSDKLEEAVQLMENVRSDYRDRQWYGVRIALEEKMAVQARIANHTATANVCEEKVKQLKDEYKHSFQETFQAGLNLLPEFDDLL